MDDWTEKGKLIAEKEKDVLQALGKFLRTSHKNTEEKSSKSHQK